VPQTTTTASPPPAMTQAVEDSLRTLTQGIETTVIANLDVQQALVESTVSIIKASFAANKTTVEQWLALSKQQQPSLIKTLENGVHTFEKFVPVVR
jgi:hypothetical protein